MPYIPFDLIDAYSEIRLLHTKLRVPDILKMKLVL
jgi:hypothetical protein